MPTYDYVCDQNGREIAVYHAMSTRLTTWGELCDTLLIDPGPTPRDASIERRIGTGMVLAPRPDQLSGSAASCCGTHGCGD